MGGDRAASAEEPAGRPARGRQADHLRHHTRSQDGLPVVRLPVGVRSAHHRLQSFQPLVAASFLERTARIPGCLGCGSAQHRHRFDLREGPAIRFRWKRGARTQAIGPSRGGSTTKLHALTDVVGRPFAIALTAGNISDVKAAPALLGEGRGIRHLIADKGYDADALRRSLRQAGAVPVIPGRRNRKRPVRYDKARYRERHLVENAFCRLKDFRRIATRYDKLAANFLSAVALAAIVAFWL